MARAERPSAAAIGRGLLAGATGTVMMTAFQRFVEMPITGRADSYAPADFAERVLRIHPSTPKGRKRLNELTHFALGGMWGTAYGIAAWRGLRGMKAVNAVFVTVYTGDVVVNTVLGLYQPRQWTARDWAIDVVDKYVQALATGMPFGHLLTPGDAPQK